MPISILSLNLNYILRYIFFFIPEILQLKKFIKKKNFDIIYATSGLYSIKVILAAAMLNKKIVVHFHDAYCNYFFLSLSNLFKKFIDSFFFSSKKSYNFYKSYLDNGNFTIVQSGIYVKKKINFKKKTQNSYNILTVANINPIKNFEFLIEVAHSLKNIKNINFTVIGKVWRSQEKYFNKINNLKNKYKLKNIKFIINSNKDLINRYTNNSDIYLCTSKNESSPMSIWESMSAGKPIISTNVGDLNIFKKKYKFGFIIDICSINLFKKKILELYKNNNMQYKMGRQAYLFAKNELNIVTISKKIKKIFLKL